MLKSFQELLNAQPGETLVQPITMLAVLSHHAIFV